MQGEHASCQHTWKYVNLGAHPQPTEPWRPLIFRVHCVVTRRWMKIRVPFGWFWFGSQAYGNPEVESGTIADANPKPPLSALQRQLNAIPLTNDRGEVPEGDLEAYQTPLHRLPPPPSPEEQEMMSLREEMRQMKSKMMELQMGDDSARGGR